MSRKTRVALYASGLAVMFLAGMSAVIALAWLTNGWALIVLAGILLGYVCTSVATFHVKELERQESRR